MNKPREISPAEWKELMQGPAIKDSWGLEDDTSPEQFANMVYGVKFDFTSGGPGYVGDLYVLHGDAIGEPITLIKRRWRVGSGVKYLIGMPIVIGHRRLDVRSTTASRFGAYAQPIRSVGPRLPRVLVRCYAMV